MTGRYERIAFVASLTPEAEKARDDLVREYGGTSPEQADVIVALGGDGLMLQTLHKFMSSGKPIYGINRGTIGFLMNEFHLKRLRERLAAAETTITHPLVMHAVDVDLIGTNFGPLMRSRCSANPTRPRGCGFWLTARSGWPSSLQMACS